MHDYLLLWEIQKCLREESLIDVCVSPYYNEITEVLKGLKN